MLKQPLCLITANKQKQHNFPPPEPIIYLPKHKVLTNLDTVFILIYISFQSTIPFPPPSFFPTIYPHPIHPHPHQLFQHFGEGIFISGELSIKHKKNIHHKKTVSTYYRLSPNHKTVLLFLIAPINL